MREVEKEKKRINKSKKSEYMYMLCLDFCYILCSNPERERDSLSYIYMIKWNICVGSNERRIWL